MPGSLFFFVTWSPGLVLITSAPHKPLLGGGLQLFQGRVERGVPFQAARSRRRRFPSQHLNRNSRDLLGLSSLSPSLASSCPLRSRRMGNWSNPLDAFDWLSLQS